MNKKIEPLLISRNLSIRDTMRTITNAAKKGAPSGIALIVNKKKQLIGVVTDGDIRRALVNNVNIDSSIEQIMIKDPITVPKSLSEREMLDLVSEKVKAKNRLQDAKVDQVIIIDQSDSVDDVVNFFDLWKASDLKNRTICVVGLGFVGLTLSVVLADVGFNVIGYDINETTVRQINDGNPPFHEKGLSSLLRFHLNQGSLKALANIPRNTSDIYILAVCTPVEDNNEPNMQSLLKSAAVVSKVIKKRDMVIARSTVPVGTTRNLLLPILQDGSGLTVGEDFYVAYAPERTVAGNALQELRSLPQVIGGYNKTSLDIASNFLSNLNHTIVRTSSLEAAEIVKLVNNSFRDISFAFANELNLICERWNLDANKVIKSANEGYPRNKIPVPSPGVGGTCLRKDPYLYIHSARSVNLDINLPRVSRAINEYMPLFVFQKIDSFFKASKNSDDLKVFLIGFAFKGEPETSDVRNSTTIDLVSLIKQKRDWKLFGYDPIVDKNEIQSLGITGCSLREGFKDADCVLIMNNHRSYHDLDILGLLELMNEPAFFFDGWHLFPREEINRVKGIIYGGLSGAN